MSLDGDIMARMRAISGVPVQQDYASAEKVQPRIWVQRATGQRPLSLSGQALIREDVYAVEVEGMDPDAVADLAESLSAEASDGGMNGLMGVVGGTMVLGCFAEDAGDSFAFRGLGLDEGYHSAAFNLRVLTGG